jgi:hypothetical protein
MGGGGGGGALRGGTHVGSLPLLFPPATFASHAAPTRNLHPLARSHPTPVPLFPSPPPLAFPPPRPYPLAHPADADLQGDGRAARHRRRLESLLCLSVPAWADASDGPWNGGKQWESETPDDTVCARLSSLFGHPARARWSLTPLSPLRLSLTSLGLFWPFPSPCSRVVSPPPALALPVCLARRRRSAASWPGSRSRTQTGRPASSSTTATTVDASVREWKRGDGDALERISSRCKDCLMQAEEASAQSVRPRDAGGKRDAREAARRDLASLEP